MQKILSLIVLLTVVGLVQAHAPSEVDVRLSGDTLIISAIHKSKKTKKHFVNKISVAINGTEVTAKMFTGQNTKEGLNTDIVLPRAVSPGDAIAVTARCNKKGETIGELKIPEAELQIAVEEIQEEVLEEEIPEEDSTSEEDSNDQPHLSLLKYQGDHLVAFFIIS